MTKGKLIAMCLLVFANGCGEVVEALKPDRVSVGITGRQIAGSYQNFKVDTTIPLWELKAKKKLRENLDAYSRLQLNHGALSADHPICSGKTRGTFTSFGFGLDYFPFETRLLGFEVGVESFYADYRMMGRLGPIKETTPGSLWGGGFNPGLVGELPLTKDQRWKLIWGISHNFTATKCRGTKASLGDWSGGVGIEIRLGP